MRNEVYTQAGGDRSESINIAGILIDGENSKVQQTAVDEAEACHLAGRFMKKCMSLHEYLHCDIILSALFCIHLGTQEFCGGVFI